MESWNNVEWVYDTYIQWIEYSLLMNVQEMTSLHHGCTHITDWQSIRVALKPIVDVQSFDFYQVNHFMCKQSNQ